MPLQQVDRNAATKMVVLKRTDAPHWPRMLCRPTEYLVKKEDSLEAAVARFPTLAQAREFLNS